MTITWADLAPKPNNTYELTSCPHCAHVVARRLPERTYHRNLSDATLSSAEAAGTGIITTCPKCGGELRSRWPLARRNLAN